MNARVINYLNWLNDRGIEIPIQSLGETPSVEDSRGLAFIARDAGHPNFQWRILFSKMLSAVEASSAPLIEAKGNLERYSRIVALGQEAAADLGFPELKAGAWTEHKGRSYFLTLHPSELVINPQLKRTAWEHLKKIQKST